MVSPAPAPFEARPASYTPKHLAEKILTILTSRSALEGERRQVTVFFTDLAGFTPMAEKLDPEDVHRIMDRCFELITAEVHRFEGSSSGTKGWSRWGPMPPVACHRTASAWVTADP
jgi:class 3 adenylate cyclase